MGIHSSSSNEGVAAAASPLSNNHDGSASTDAPCYYGTPSFSEAEYIIIRINRRDLNGFSRGREIAVGSSFWHHMNMNTSTPSFDGTPTADEALRTSHYFYENWRERLECILQSRDPAVNLQWGLLFLLCAFKLQSSQSWKSCLCVRRSPVWKQKDQRN